MEMKIEVTAKIPDAFIEQLAVQIAEKVIARLHLPLDKPIDISIVSSKAARNQVQPTFLRLPEVVHRLGVARGTIYRWIYDGRFPKSVTLGGRAVAWRRTDIEAWERDPSKYLQQ